MGGQQHTVRPVRPIQLIYTHQESSSGHRQTQTILAVRGSTSKQVRVWKRGVNFSRTCVVPLDDDVQNSFSQSQQIARNYVTHKKLSTNMSTPARIVAPGFGALNKRGETQERSRSEQNSITNVNRKSGGDGAREEWDETNETQHKISRTISTACETHETLHKHFH